MPIEPTTRWFVSIIGLIVVFASGCGSDGRVSGSVTLDGKTLEGGGIVFHAPAGGSTAFGTINNGRYKLFVGQGEQISPGEYAVTVEQRTAISAQEGASAGPPVEDAGTRLTPDIYADPTTSPLKATVKPGANSLDFDLKTQP